MKRIFALALSIALCFSLSACGEDTIEDVIEEARDFIEDIDNVHCAVVSGMDIVEGEDSLSNYLSMTADMDIENRIYHMNMATSSDGEDMAMEFYITLGDTIDYYIGANDKWVKMPNVDREKFQGIDVNTDVRRDFEVYFSAFLETPETILTEEELEGEMYYKLQAPIKITSMDMAKKFNIDTFITSILGDESSPEMANALLGKLGMVEVVVYVNCDTYAPYGFVVDTKPALDALYKNLGDTSIEVKEAYTSSIYTDYNELEDVVLPEAARFAPDISSVQNTKQ